MEEEYTVNASGQVEPDLLMLMRLLLSKYKTVKSLRKRCLPLNSLEDCCAEELIFLTRCVIPVLLDTEHINVHCRVAEYLLLAAYPEQVSETGAQPSRPGEKLCWRVVLGQQNSLRKLISLITLITC